MLLLSLVRMGPLPRRPLRHAALAHANRPQASHREEPPPQGAPCGLSGNSPEPIEPRTSRSKRSAPPGSRTLATEQRRPRAPCSAGRGTDPRRDRAAPKASRGGCEDGLGTRPRTDSSFPGGRLMTEERNNLDPELRRIQRLLETAATDGVDQDILRVRNNLLRFIHSPGAVKPRQWKARLVVAFAILAPAAAAAGVAASALRVFRTTP